MDDPLSHVMPGRHITAVLSSGQQCRGTVTNIGKGWITLGGGEQMVLVQITHVAAINLDSKPTPSPIVDIAMPKPTSKETPVRAGSKALGRAWLDDDLKKLADAYLDGAQDAELAQRFSRAKGQIKELRQAFECARGNLVDDQISPIAATWVPRWRKALQP